jgi:membrane protease YdiL (CAAX protease family)
MKGSVLSTRRVVYVMAKLALRRHGNRLVSHFRSRKKRKDDDGKRHGTPGKSRMRLPLVVILSAVFVFNGVMIASQMVNKLSAWATHDARDTVGPMISSSTAQTLEEIAARVRLPDGTLSEGERGRVVEIFQMELLHHRREAAVKEGHVDTGLTENGELRCEHLADHFYKFGAEGFVREAKAEQSHPFAVRWPPDAAMPRFIDGFGLIVALLWVALLVMTFTSASQEIGKVEWTFEWLYSFPAGTRGLFLARIFEYAFTQMFAWFTIFPLFLVLLSCSGAGLWAAPIAMVLTVYQNIIIASLRVLGETWLRLNLGVARLKNLQAVLSVVGILCFYCVLYVAISRELPDWFETLANERWSRLAWLPSNLPLLFLGDGSGWWVAAAHTGVLVAFLSLGVYVPSYLVRGGLVRSGGGFQGDRGVARPRLGNASSKGWLRGVLGKEVCLLIRDRSFFVQTLVVPVLIVGFQVVLNSQLLTSGVNDFRHAGALAFGVGAYVLMFGAASVLTVEGPALWLLYTFPVRLDAVLRRKTVLWAVVSSLYGLTVLVWLAWAARRFDLTVVGVSLMAIVGIVIYSFVTAGIATMSVRPEDLQGGRLQRRSNPEVMMLYFIVGPLYAYGFYAPSVWARFAVVALFALLACALWQKVRERIPFLLDPTALPPPRINLSDGLIAVLVFFVVQGVIMGFAMAIRSEGFEEPALPRGEDMALSFVTSGVIVVAATFYVFWRKKVPDVLRTVGIRSAGRRRFGFTGGILLGTIVGLGAAGFAFLYLEVVERVPALQALKESSHLFPGDNVSEGFEAWIAGLAILAAPLFEEFIFRGLVYTGLRRTFPVWGSACISAGVFALVHPAIALPPVFVLGLCAALVFEWSGWLLSAVVAHTVYNLTVVLGQQM